VKTQKKPARTRRARRQPSKSKTTKTAPAGPAELRIAEEPRPAVPEPSPPPAEATGGTGDVLESAPEPAFAARVPSPEPERPLPSTRRAIFFDVENSSRPEHVSRVIDHLAIDRQGRATEIVAVGNWKVIGHDTARLLARHGAHLVHSAPSTGVRDWSDLRIAVSAGIWVAAARPGDILEIVTDDRAFDVVGDVAASLGIAFRRLSYRALAEMAGEVVEAVEPRVSEPRPRRRRPRRRGRSGAPPPSHQLGVSPASAVAAADRTEPPVEPHTAPHDEIVAVVRDLLHASSGPVVSIDALANALKRKGFRRPPGSPRLITRLRRIKELVVSQSGMIALADSGGSAETGQVAAVPPGGRRAHDPRNSVATNDLRDTRTLNDLRHTPAANDLPTGPENGPAESTGHPGRATGRLAEPTGHFAEAPGRSAELTGRPGAPIGQAGEPSGQPGQPGGQPGRQGGQAGQPVGQAPEEAGAATVNASVPRRRSRRGGRRRRRRGRAPASV
jgi:hypothetical protein